MTMDIKTGKAWRPYWPTPGKSERLPLAVRWQYQPPNLQPEASRVFWLIDWSIFILPSRGSNGDVLFWTNPHQLWSWPFSNFSGWRLTSSHVNLLLVRSHQAAIIIVKRLIQGCNNMTRVWFEARSCDQDRRKNDAFTHSATLPTIVAQSWTALFRAFSNYNLLDLHLRNSVF